MNVFINENMIYWEQNNKAAQYIVSLYIGAKISLSYSYGRKEVYIPDFLMDKHDTKEEGDIAYQKIDEIYIAKSKTYHTFMDLVDISKKIDNSPRTVVASICYKTTYLNYYVEVVAEDKLGNIIDKSELILMTISRR